MNRPDKAINKIKNNIGTVLKSIIDDNQLESIYNYIHYLESQLKDQEGEKINIHNPKGYLSPNEKPEMVKIKNYLEKETGMYGALLLEGLDENIVYLYFNSFALIIKELQNLPFLLPTDEEIGKYLLSLYGEGMLNKNAAILFCAWLKTKIKGIPKELSEEDVNEIKENEFALSYLPNEGIKSLYEKIIQHLTEKEQV